MPPILISHSAAYLICLRPFYIPGNMGPPYLSLRYGDIVQGGDRAEGNPPSRAARRWACSPRSGNHGCSCVYQYLSQVRPGRWENPPTGSNERLHPSSVQPVGQFGPSRRVCLISHFCHNTKVSASSHPSRNRLLYASPPSLLPSLLDRLHPPPGSRSISCKR